MLRQNVLILMLGIPMIHGLIVKCEMTWKMDTSIGAILISWFFWHWWTKLRCALLWIWGTRTCRQADKCAGKPAIVSIIHISIQHCSKMPNKQFFFRLKEKNQPKNCNISFVHAVVISSAGICLAKLIQIDAFSITRYKYWSQCTHELV